MATKGEKRWRWQFSLRGLLVSMLVVGVGLGLVVRWWFAPIIEREHYPNGALRRENWRQRNWRGEMRRIKTVQYYSTGQKASEAGPADDRYPGEFGEVQFWLPNGEPAWWESAIEAMRKDAIEAGESVQ